VWKKKGVQFAFLIEDRSGSIKTIADVIRDYDGRVVSILTSYEHAPAGYRKLYIRAYQIDREKLPQLQKDLKAIFRSLHKTVLMVTHDLSEADYFADEIILMKEGQIVQKGLITDFRENPENRFVTRFIEAQHYLPGDEGKDKP